MPPRNSILHLYTLSLTKHNFLLDKFLCRPTLFHRDTALLFPRPMSLSVPVFTPKTATTPPPEFSTTVRFIGLWMHTLITSIYNATIANFAEAYVRIAAEQHGVYPIPERLPTEREVADMISNANYMRSSLEAVRQTVQEANERASAAGKAKSYEDEDSHMYDSAKQNYGIGEVKKRRGVS
ncbi:hypothetical protein ACHAPS_002005 [Verticillium nonalfalfae]